MFHSYNKIYVADFPKFRPQFPYMQDPMQEIFQNIAGNDGMCERGCRCVLTCTIALCLALH